MPQPEKPLADSPDAATTTADVIEREALRLFRAKGYHATSVREIASAAGVGPATLFHHFPAKDAILARLLHRGVDDVQAAFEEVVGANPDPVQRLMGLVRVLVIRHAEEQEKSFVGTSELRGLAPTDAADVLAKRLRLQRMVQDAVSEGCRAGHFHVRDPMIATTAIVTMSIAVATWYRKGGPITPEQLAGQYVDMALGLLGHGASEQAK